MFVIYKGLILIMKRYWKYTIMNNKESDADWKFTIQKKLSIIFSKYMIFNWKQTIISFNAVRFVVYVNFDLNSGPQFDPDLKNVRISKSGLTQNRLYFFSFWKSIRKIPLRNPYPIKFWTRNPYHRPYRTFVCGFDVGWSIIVE